MITSKKTEKKKKLKNPILNKLKQFKLNKKTVYLQTFKIDDMDIYEQQGQDITATDMIIPEDDSDIREFYRGSCVFITGATGFLGKLAVEKLLRTCPNLKKIFILIRAKKGKDVKQRFEEIFNEPVSIT